MEDNHRYSRKEVLYIVGLVFLVYTVIWLGALLLIGHEKAIVAADVSGIGIAIVLAVIAIVWTMVDSSGQRQNVMQLQDTISKFNSSFENISQLLGDTRNLADQLNSMIKQNEEWRSSIFEEIQGLKSVTNEKDVDPEVKMKKVEMRLEEVSKKVVSPIDLRKRVSGLMMIDLPYNQFLKSDYLSIIDDTFQEFTGKKPIFSYEELLDFTKLTLETERINKETAQIILYTLRNKGVPALGYDTIK